MLEQQLFDEVLKLPPATRASFAERILATLEQPDSSILQQWAEEAENRIKAYESGLIEVFSAEEVFAKYKMQ